LTLIASMSTAISLQYKGAALVRLMTVFA